MRNRNLKYLVGFLILFCSAIIAQNKQIEFELDDNGVIKSWLVNGPVDQPLVGFGTPTDKEIINEKIISPVWGGRLETSLSFNGWEYWEPQSPNSRVLRFSESLGRVLPGKNPEKLWYAKAGFAYAIINSTTTQDITLLFGSNSGAVIYLNGKKIYSNLTDRNAVADQDKIPLHLMAGENKLLIKVLTTHKNHSLSFFIPLEMKWGFYSRLVGMEENTVTTGIPVSSLKTKSEYNIQSTIFFKKEKENLLQRFDVNIVSNNKNPIPGNLTVSTDDKDYSFSFENIKFGKNRFEIYLPDSRTEYKLKTELVLDNVKLENEISVKPENHYKLYYSMISHMDIGYTHTQPIVKEIHIKTLDDVIDRCKKDKDFKWTIETLWIVHQFEKVKSDERFKELMHLVKEGRIALSPIYSNPFTGWISFNEAMKSLDYARYLKNKFDIEFSSAIYNDVPGESWFIPQLLCKNKINFLVNGINEVYNDYKFQKELPKAFWWEAANGNKVINYITETYTEGMYYGLERDVNAIELKLIERLYKLKARDYNYDMVYINSAFTDNSGIPNKQYENIKKWNEEYEYPKFIISNLNEFGKVFSNKYADKLPTLRGDWTSEWDVQFQSEAEKFVEYRKVQNKYLTAENLSSFAKAIDTKNSVLRKELHDVKENLLNFSGHGSALEYGFGTSSENKLTMDYRKNYLDNANLVSDEIIQRSFYKLINKEIAFENHGVIVFNPLSWSYKTNIVIEDKQGANNSYVLYDYANNKVLPSYHLNGKNIFITDSLPSLGYKKYYLKSVNEFSNSNHKLSFSKSSVENEFYKIHFDENSGHINKIIDKEIQQTIFTDGSVEFNQLYSQKHSDQNIIPIALNEIQSIEVIDNLPVSVELIIRYDKSIVKQTSYVLWEGIKRIDIKNIFDLSLLGDPVKAEAYYFSFPIPGKNNSAYYDLLGGTVSKEDLLLNSENKLFSVRQTASITNNKFTLSVASPEARIYGSKIIDGNRILCSNPINSFPKGWNRQDKKDGLFSINYSLFTYMGEFNSGVSNRFGLEVNTNPILKDTWFKSEPIQKEFVNSSNNNVQIVNVTYIKENCYEFCLKNLTNENQLTDIQSEEFKFANARDVQKLFSDKSLKIQKNKISIEVEKNSYRIIKVELN